MYVQYSLHCEFTVHVSKSFLTLHKFNLFGSEEYIFSIFGTTEKTSTSARIRNSNWMKKNILDFYSFFTEYQFFEALFSMTL